MTTTIQVNLSGLAFTLEEQAYQKLKSYLDSINKHFESNQDKDEIIRDVENSIADKFSKKLNTNKNVINQSDIEEIIQTLGHIEDFNFESESTSTKEKSNISSNKKLYRDPQSPVIAGVCSGLGNYFGINPVFIRIIFVILILTPLNTIIIYIVLWIIMPLAQNTAEKMEMKGQAVNISNIVNNVKRSFTEKDSSGQTRFEKGIGFASKSVGESMPALMKIFGIVLVVFSCIPLFMTFSSAVFSLLIPFFYSSDFNLLTNGSFNNQIIFFLMTLSISICLAIPFLFILFAGISLIKRKWILNYVLAIGLLFIWITSIILGTFSAVKFKDQVEISKEKYTTSKVYDIKDFDKIQLNSNNILHVQKGSEYKVIKDFDKIQLNSNNILHVQKGSEYKVRVSGLNQDLENLQVRNENRTLKFNSNISSNKDDTVGLCIFICVSNGLEIWIEMPDLERLDLSGDSSTEIKDFEGLDNIDIILSGDSRLKMQGSSEYLGANISGNSELEAFNFEAKNAKLEVSDDSNAEVFASENLKVNATGTSDIKYKGNPKNLDERITEDSDIMQINLR